MPPVILPRSEHSVSRKNIDPDALKVLYRLKSAGHIAYLVGGSVRDLLLERKPKDFDISTSALPNEVRRLFRNCRLIGRRFRLAHIVFGRDKVVEVATFRRKSEELPESEGDLLVRRDNTFGTPEEDALRRDFTANGMFYDIATFSIIDWVGGLKDLEERTIRTIGDPAVRYREDPVRMLRAVKFAARLSFHIAEEDLEAIRRFRGDLLRMSPERLRLELGRLLSAGQAARSFVLLEETGLLDVVSPELKSYLEEQRAQQPVGSEGTGQDRQRLADLEGLDRLVERRRREGIKEELPQPVLLGALLTPIVLGAAPPAPPPPVLSLRGLGFAHGQEPLPELPAGELAAEEGEPARVRLGGETSEQTTGETAGPGDVAEPGELDVAPIPGDPIEDGGEPEQDGGEAATLPGGEGWEAGNRQRGPDPEDAADMPEGVSVEALASQEEDRAGEEIVAEMAPVRPARGRRAALPVFAGSDPAALVEEQLAPFLLRFQVPRRDTELLVQILAAQRRMRRPGRREGAHRQLVRKDYFAEALLLFECHVLGTRQGQRELALWQGLEGTGGGPAAGRGEREGPGGRRRRRGRRRGSRGSAENGTGSGAAAGRGRDHSSEDRMAPDVAPDTAELSALDETADNTEVLSEREEARLRQKAEADQMRREQAFQSGRYLPAPEPGFRARGGYPAAPRPQIDPRSPLGSPIAVSGDRPADRGRRRRRRRGGRGGSQGGGPNRGGGER